MNEKELDALYAWFSVFVSLRKAGASALAEVLAVVRKHGHEGDTAALDAVIADAARREAMAQREATGDVTGPVVTGSIGE